MSNRDRKYTQGGANADGGNYEADYTIGSRALRLICAERGNWPGGRGRVIGARFRTLKKMDEETVHELPGMVDEAWEPLTEADEMDNVAVRSEAHPDIEGAVQFWADFTDRTTGDNLSHKLPAGSES